MISSRPDNSEGVKDLADHVLSRMFNHKTFQVVRDRNFAVVTLDLDVVS